MLNQEHQEAMISELLTPRLAVLITTVDSDGVVNAAPYSFFSPVAYDPPMVQLSIFEQKHVIDEKDLAHNEQVGSVEDVLASKEYAGEERTTRKDTLHNISERGEFGVSALPTEYVSELVAAATRWPFGRSELEVVGLETYDSSRIDPPLVAEADVGVECRVVDSRSLKGLDGERAGFTTVFGQVVASHVDSDILVDGDVSPDALDPLLEFSRGIFMRTSGTVSEPQYTYPDLSSGTGSD